MNNRSEEVRAIERLEMRLIGVIKEESGPAACSALATVLMTCAMAQGFERDEILDVFSTHWDRLAKHFKDMGVR
jgi:hypothetical protein